jgi:hypothetical protein
MVYVIQVCRQLSSRIRMELVSSWSGSKAVCMTYTIAECTVNNSWRWTEELSETRRVSFQNKFDKSVHLLGFITRICHDARSHVTMHGHMSWCTVTCHDALSHVMMHGHKSWCTVTCHDARSHERKIKTKVRQYMYNVILCRLFQWKSNNAFCECCYSTVTVNSMKLLTVALWKLLWQIHFAGNPKTHWYHHVKCLIFLFDFNQKFGVSRQSFTIVPKVKFHGNPSCWGNENACGQTSRKRSKTKKN